ncbi:hypothetical protein ABZU32_14560 [Sphaerisporangium sp. NPDC005288]|uniref:hypothetical protein n=1 Tax=Sphaerisporangium sp. NPDC005288 TaxID=3155114 RepID=UPI0033B2A718
MSLSLLVRVPGQPPLLMVGDLTYDDHLLHEGQVPGVGSRRENGTWLLRPRAEGGTVVTHGFQHQGPLARALSRAYRGVAELRLDRLSQRAEHPGR